MRTWFLPIILVLHLNAFSQEIPPIGEWREHLPYHNATGLAQVEGKIYCATPYSIFSVDLDDHEITRRSRMNGLSETGVAKISGNESGTELLIAYQNSNLDILRGNRVLNIPGIKQSTSPGDKSIHGIYPRGGLYYLSAGLGVIIIDPSRLEVKDTWYPGNGGGYVQTNAFCSDGNFFYAATEEGLKRISMTANPHDPSSWQNLGGMAGLPAGPAFSISYTGGSLVACVADTLYRWMGSGWMYFYHGQMPIVGLEAKDDKFIVCERLPGGPGRITLLNANGTLYRVLANTAAVSFPADAILVNNIPWVADRFAGLSRIFTDGTHESFVPNSPLAVSSGEMTHESENMYVAAGAVNDAWNYTYNGDGLFIFSHGQWENIHRNRFPVIDSLLDIISIVPDPRDDSWWAGSFGGGLLRGHAGSFEIFKQGYLGETVGDPGSFRVAGLAFDRDKNLWISNFGSTQPLRVRKAGGDWKAFSPPVALIERAVSQIVVDDQNYKWIVSPLGNGLLAFDHGSDLDNTGDDRWRLFRAGNGSGNLPSSDVRCIAKDRQGQIWVGTANGMAVLECGSETFTPATCDAAWPVVQMGSFAGYLFQGQEVNSIAVDGANRKWVATRGGVALVSANGEEVIFRFTENNSPLLSNDVREVTIDGKTGEVFFATQKGLCSFRSTATDPQTEAKPVVAIFPNPVPPGYNGTIGIRGLRDNSIVKITELDGRLVFETRSLGGQAVWSGRNYRGQKISSGAYLVLVSDGDGKMNVAGKVFFVK